MTLVADYVPQRLTERGVRQNLTEPVEHLPERH